jgi:hypothetical protein
MGNVICMILDFALKRSDDEKRYEIFSVTKKENIAIIEIGYDPDVTSVGNELLKAGDSYEKICFLRELCDIGIQLASLDWQNQQRQRNK